MPDEPQIQIHVPESVVGGHFADFVAVTQNGKYFTLDFAAITGQQEATVNAQVVTRVRILPDQIFQMMRALNEQLAFYEKATGQAGPPPEVPPADLP